MKLDFVRLPVKDYWKNRAAAGVKLLEARRDAHGAAASLTATKPRNTPGVRYCDFCGCRMEEVVCKNASPDWPHPPQIPIPGGSFRMETEEFKRELGR